jgi:hypothetical protein
MSIFGLVHGGGLGAWCWEPLLSELKELLPSGGQATFDNRVGWARTYIKKAGLLESPRRGYLKITERSGGAQAEAAVERGTGRRYEHRSRGTADDLRAWISDRREADEAMAAMYGTYQLYMLTGQAPLDDLQNDRYPDIEPATLERLSAEKAA